MSNGLVHRKVQAGEHPACRRFHTPAAGIVRLAVRPEENERVTMKWDGGVAQCLPGVQ